MTVRISSRALPVLLAAVLIPAAIAPLAGYGQSQAGVDKSLFVSVVDESGSRSRTSRPATS